MRPATGQMVRCERLPGWIFLGDNFEATLGQLCGNLETTADGRMVRCERVPGWIFHVENFETTLGQPGDNFGATWRQLPAGASVCLCGSWIRCLPGPYPAQKGEEGKVHSCPTHTRHDVTTGQDDTCGKAES